MKHARVLGYGTPWQKKARQGTDSSEASRVNINLILPPISANDSTNNNDHHNPKVGIPQE